MSYEDGLISAYILDGQGSGIQVKWEEVQQWQASSDSTGTLWVHLDYEKPDAVRWLMKHSGLDKVTARAMMVEESRPRSVIHPEGVLVFLRGVNLNPGQDPEDMVSIRVWLGKRMIITTRKRSLLCISDLRKMLHQGHGPKSPPDFLCALNDLLLDRMSGVIEGLEDEVDDLEKAVVTDESHVLRASLADIRCQCIAIRRYLAPQREAMGRLFYESNAFMDEGDRVRMRESNDRLIRFIEDLDAARDRAVVTQEELSSRLSEQLNRRMYLLSVVAAIFLPLTFITGLLGINVGGIPGANNGSAFVIVCSSMGMLLLCMLLWFKRRKWL